MLEHNKEILEVVEKIRGRLREYLELKGIKIDGNGFFSCINPSHPDKNPSCSIGGQTEEKVFHCFSCNTAGNIFHAAHFLDNKPLTGVGFYEDTMKYLADMFKIPYEPIDIPEDVKREYQKRRAYHDAMNVCHAGAYKGAELNREHPAIKHLLERGITEEGIKKFKIGCIENYQDYLKDMKNLGWTDEEWLKGADLGNKGIFNKEGIIIPIIEPKGGPVGFVTRTTKMNQNDHGQNKFINSLNSDIYHKSEILYNFNNYQKEQGPLYIVEGYLDAVYLDQVGIKNVAAIGATVLTEQHVDMLIRNSVKDIIICLDADEGGVKGVKLALERLSSYKLFRVKVVELPDNYDPDNYVREFGVTKFEQLSRVDSFSPFIWTIKHTTFEDDPMAVVDQAVPTIAMEERHIHRLKMIRELAKITGIPEIDIKRDVESFLSKESGVYLDELRGINDFVRMQLQKRKVQDTKTILEEAIIKVRSVDSNYNKKNDSKDEFITRFTDIKEKIISGKYHYGLKVPRFKKFEQKLDGVPFSTCLTLVGGRPSAGKCLAKGTKIWTTDGLKYVEDITITDLLIGDDGTPRRILSTTNGVDLMYRIKQTNAIDYVVNSPHILSLKRSRNEKKSKHGEILDISVEEFIKKSNKFKNNFKGYKVPIEFLDSEVLIEPYFLGLWIGDGASTNVTIYNTDKEVINYLYEYANRLELQVTENLNGTCPSYSITKGRDFNSTKFSLQQLLRLERIIGNGYKYIPQQYIMTSRKNRLELLAGIIDSDGCYIRKQGYFEITQVEFSTIEQIKLIADSLGFRTNINKKKTSIKKTGFIGEAWRLNISGNIWEIPTKIKRKKAEYRNNKRDWSLSNITITPEGYGEYYGFEIDGNRRFLLEDGTVTHNTVWITALSVDLIESNDDLAVFFMSIDDTTELMVQKMIAMATGLSTSEIKAYSSLSQENKTKVEKAMSWFDKYSDRFILVDASSGNSVETLESNIDWFVKQFPNKKKIAFLDNFHKLRLPPTSKRTDAAIALSEKVKDVTQLNDMHLIATVELRKLLDSKSKPTVDDLKDTVQLEYDADIIILFHNELQVNPDTQVTWRGFAGTTPVQMPFLEARIWKNKITGKTGELGYKLNSHSLQITEVAQGDIKALRDKSMADSNKSMLDFRRTRQ